MGDGVNAHALAALNTRQPEDWPTTEEWIVHTVCVSLAWSALHETISREIECEQD